MANVNNSISLQDKMTPVLSNIIRSLDLTVKAMKSVNAESNKVTQEKAFIRANNAIKQANNALDKMTQEMKEADKAADATGLSLKGWQGNLMGAQAALQLFNAGLNGARRVLEVIQKFNEAAYGEDIVQTRLASQLRNVVRTREEGLRAQQEINRIAQEGEQRTVVAGSATVAGASQLATYGLQVQSIQRLLPALQDLAVGMYGVNVSDEQMISTAQLLGKTLNGQAAALTRYGIQMSEAEKKILETGKESQKTELMIKLLGRSFGGLAENMAQSSAGARVQFQNTWQNMMETVGATTANAFTSIYKSLSNEMPRIQALIQRTADMIVPAIEWIANTGIPMTIDVLETVIPVIQNVVDFIVTNWQTIRTILSMATLGLSDIVFKLIELWQKNRDTGGAIVKQWNRIKDTIVDVAVSIKLAVMGAFQDMINFAIDQINTLIEYVNKIPGVNISKIENATFADRAAKNEAEKALKREQERQVRDTALEEKYGNITQFGSGKGGAETLWSNFNGPVHTVVDSINDEVKIGEDDLKYLKDVAMKDFDVKYQQVTPSVNISNMNVNKTADVSEVMDALEQGIAEASNADINVGISYGN